MKVSQNLESLETTRMALRKQKIFHHKFDLKLSDQANMHLYKDVYVPNEKCDPKVEKQQDTLEFIR